MAASLTNAAGWIARFVLSAAVLCCNEWRVIGPAEWTHPTATNHAETRSGRDKKPGFHATVSVGRGKRQVTVMLEFGDTGERSEDEVL